MLIPPQSMPPQENRRVVFQTTNLAQTQRWWHIPQKLVATQRIAEENDRSVGKSFFGAFINHYGNWLTNSAIGSGPFDLDVNSLYLI